MTGLTKYGKETIINFNQDEVNASIYTCDEAWIRMLDKLVASDYRVSLDTKDKYSKTYIIPKSAIKVRMSRQLSDEKRKELILRAKHNFHK